mmetsp:Transcript_31521/g.80379  ORF Transcript_31521/g.80379 Transcript_31521/m.80379 type:complete len:209 (-) Transcript_31521:1151-1777(-)
MMRSSAHSCSARSSVTASVSAPASSAMFLWMFAHTSHGSILRKTSSHLPLELGAFVRLIFRQRWPFSELGESRSQAISQAVLLGCTSPPRRPTHMTYSVSAMTLTSSIFSATFMLKKVPKSSLNLNAISCSPSCRCIMRVAFCSTVSCVASTRVQSCLALSALIDSLSGAPGERTSARCMRSVHGMRSRGGAKFGDCISAKTPPQMFW